MSIRTYFENIAEAIREKTETTDTFTPSQMPDAIRGIQGGGGFEPSEYSDYLNGVFDTGVAINATYAVECAFYANAYQNDGHIIGSMATASGSGFHLTTYSNRWYASNGSSEFSFNANDQYPLYGKDIVYRLSNGVITMNGVQVGTSNMGTIGGRYALNTRGGSISTTGKYKYKYFRLYNSDGELLHDFIFGTILDGAVKLVYDTITGEYRGYI